MPAKQGRPSLCVLAVSRIHSSTPFNTLTFFLTTSSNGRPPGWTPNCDIVFQLKSPFSVSVGRPVDNGGRVDPPCTDEAGSFLTDWYADLADEPLVQADLGLASQIVVEPGEDDDDLVAGIGRLADQTGVVARLAGLNIADHHSAAVERSIAGRVAEQVENPVGYAIARIDRLLREPFANEEAAIPFPELPVDFIAPPVDPWNVIVIGAQDGLVADKRAEYRSQLRDRGVARYTIPPFGEGVEQPVERVTDLVAQERRICCALRQPELGHLDQFALEVWIDRHVRARPCWEASRRLPDMMRRAPNAIRRARAWSAPSFRSMRMWQ